MNKAFDQIIERLGELHERYINQYGVVGGNPMAFSVKGCMEIVQEVAEEYNGGWIPCSERLPECGIKVLVQYGCGRINIEECKKNTDGIIGFYDGNYWSNADNYIYWQPLPEPYKESD